MQMAYYNLYKHEENQQLEVMCQEFVSKICQLYPELTQKPKINLLLHLVQCIEWFGPTSSFNTDR